MLATANKKMLRQAQVMRLEMNRCWGAMWHYLYSWRKRDTAIYAFHYLLDGSGMSKGLFQRLALGQIGDSRCPNCATRAYELLRSINAAAMSDLRSWSSRATEC